MTKKIIAIISVISMLMTAILPMSIYAAAGDKTADILIDESFNKLSTGSVPSDSFSVKRAGGADMSIVNKPDAKNKSVFMTGAMGGTASLEKTVANPENVSLTLSFKFNMQNKGSFTFVQVSNEKDTAPTSMFEVTDGTLTLGGETLAELETGRWYYAEVTFNVATKSYAISLDNKKLVRKEALNDSEVAIVRLMVSDSTQKLYLDEILLRRADLGIDGQEYYKYSELFVSPVQNTSVEDIALDAFLMYQKSYKGIKNGAKIDVPIPPVELNKVMYLPLRFTAENLGAEVIWNAEEKITFLVVGDNTYKVKTGESAVCHNGSPLALSGAVATVNGSMYMPATDLAKLLGETVLVDEGLVMLGGVQELYLEAEDRVKMEVRNILKYERPTGQEMYDAIIAKYPNNAHPRLHGNADDFARIRELVKTDETAKKMYEFIKESADSYLDKPVTQFPASGTFSKEDEAVQERCTELGFMYQMTGDAKYAERAWAEIDAALNFSSWDTPTATRIDVLAPSGISNGIALAYDWTYDWIQANLSDTDINRIKTTLYDRMIGYSLKVYRSVVNRTNSIANGWDWATDAYNFNPFRNIAVLCCCIAFAEDYPEDIAASLGYAMRSLEFHFDEWMPDGAWTEGPDYGYVTMNMDAEIISLLEAATGSDYGLSNVPGLIESARYNKYILGPRGYFNYSDANKQTNPENTYSFLYADKLNDKTLGYLRVESLKSSGYNTSPEEMFWYRPELVGENGGTGDKDGYFRVGETALLRSDWSQDAIFTGLHAHDNAAPHGQLDAGTIVLDAFDTEWFTDLAYDPLSYTNAEAQFGAYRARAEGHNTLVIDDTPYNTLPADEDGWLLFQNYDWETETVGETPTIFDLRSKGDASVTVEKDPDDPNNQYLELKVENGDEVGHSAFYNHLYSEPYVQNAVRYQFKMKFKDLDWRDKRNEVLGQDVQGSWKPVEIRDTDNVADYPLWITPSSFGATSKAGWHSMNLAPVAGVWYEIAIEVDVVEDTYSVYIDGGSDGGKGSLENLPLKVPFKDLYLIHLGLDTAKTSVYIDDIKVTLDPNDSAFAFKGARQYDQNRYEKTFIDKFETESQGAYAVTDLTSVYADKVDSAVRGLMLTDQRRAVVVRDEIKLKRPSDVYWFAHMRSETEAEVAEDGKSAILRKNGQRLWVGLMTDCDAKFEIRAAKPLPGSPDIVGQQENNEFKKLTLKFEEVTEVNASVAMIPLLAGQDVPDRIPEEVALKDWALPKEVLPTVDSITVDGSLIADFDASKNMYDILLPKGTTAVPQVAATANGANVTVIPAKELPGYTIIKVEKNGLTAEYTVNLRLPEVYSAEIQGYTVTGDQITVSEIVSAAAMPYMVLDNNNYTCWRSDGKNEWIQIDFQQKATLSKLSIAWWIYGDQRNHDFEVQMSDDASSWTTIYTGLSSGTTEELEEYDFGASYSGRYMRIVLHGHNEGTVNNISSIR